MLHIMVDMPDLTFIEKDLDMVKDKTPHVLRTAINNTAKKARPMLIEGITKKYQVQRKAHVAKTLDMQKATISKLQAVITSKGRSNELYDFKIKPKKYTPHPWDRPKAGHTANVKKGNPPNIVRKHEYHPGSKVDNYKGFTVKFANGHISIAQRVPGSANAISKRSKRKPGREAIKNLYTISIPTMLKETLGDDFESITYNSVSGRIQQELIRQIQQQITRYLK